jgi:putative membrane protein
VNSNTNRYSRFSRQQLILRDELALDRTVLANERTILAYLRTALALMLAGVTFMHFAKATWFWVVGVMCLVVGLGVFPFAMWRYRRLQMTLASLRQRLDDSAATGTRDEPGSTDAADR